MTARDAMATDPSKRRNRDMAVTLSRTVIGKGLTLLRSFVVLPLVTPGEFGVYRYVMAIAGYLAFLHFGANNALSLEYPRLRAQEGSEGEAAEVLAAAWRSCVIGGLIGSAVMAVVLLTSTEISVGVVAALVAMTALQLLSSMSLTSLQASRQFVRAARVGLLVDVVGFAGMVGGAYAFGVAGLLIGGMLPRVVVVLAVPEATLPQGFAELPWSRWWEVVKQGFKLMSANMVVGLALTLDIVLLGSLKGSSAAVLGLYGLGATVARQAQLITQPLSVVDTVRLSEHAGREPDARGELVLMALRSLARDCFLSGLAACVLCAGFAGFLPLLADKYQPALPAIAVLLVGATFARWQRYPLHVLGLFGRLRWTYVASGSTALVTVAGFVWLHRLGVNDAHVFARVTAAGAAITAIVLMSTTIVVAGEDAGRAGWDLLRLLLAHLPLAAFLFPRAYASPPQLAVASGVVALLLFVAYGLFFRTALTDAWAVIRTLLGTVGRLLRRGRAPKAS